MKRFKTAVLLFGMIVAAALVMAAVSPAAGESGPKCANITGEVHNYSLSQTFGMKLLLEAPACKSVVYTVYIIRDTGEQPIQVAQSGTDPVDGNPTFGPTTVTDDDPNICVFATTASKGGHVHDRATDTGCLEIQAGTPGGGSGFE